MSTDSFHAPLLALLLLGSIPAACPPPRSARPVGAEQAITANEVAEHVRVLASDEMQGRGIGTAGLERAADYIAGEWKQAGLQPGGPDGSWFQPFEMTTGVSIAEGNELVIAGKGAAPLALDTDWRPFAFSESATVEAPVVFAGYGITAPELGWDDYAGLDVKDKVVLVLRHEPGEKDPHSPFSGTKLTRYAELRVKAINARVHGAAGMLLVDDAHEPAAGDELIKLASAGGASSAGVPAVHLTRAAASRLVASAGTELAALEGAVSDGKRTASRALDGAKVRLRVALETEKAPVKNVIGVIPGSHATLKNEAIVVGAHFDHLGMGHDGTLDPNKVGEPHNGADDNASGTSALIAIAKRIAKERPPRTIIFIAFTAEEAGLGGSSWYVNHPTWPLDRIVAMLNMDMVGRMREKKVMAFGAGTATEFESILKEANTEGLDLHARGDGYGPSDQTVFYAKDIPVLHFFTGAHADYHRTTDDAERIESEGLAQIARLVARVTGRIAATGERPTYVASTSTPHAMGRTGSTGGYGAYFGSVPDFTESPEPGVALTGVRAGSPAEAAGLAAGDRIVKFGDVEVGNLHDLTFALRKYKPDDEVDVTWVRGAEKKSAKAKLSRRP